MLSTYSFSRLTLPAHTTSSVNDISDDPVHSSEVHFLYRGFLSSISNELQRMLACVLSYLVLPCAMLGNVLSLLHSRARGYR